MNDHSKDEAAEAELVRVRHDLLRERDRAEGLQAEADSARFDADEVRSRLAAAEQRLAKATARAEDLDRRVTALTNSRAMRVGKLVSSPAALLRRRRSR